MKPVLLLNGEMTAQGADQAGIILSYAVLVGASCAGLALLVWVTGCVIRRFFEKGRVNQSRTR